MSSNYELCSINYNFLGNNKPNKTCQFSSVSPCRDQISDLICNEHAGLFGLTNRRVNYTDGTNEHWSKIVLYVSSEMNLNVPMFLDTNSQLLENDITNFATSVCLNNRNIDVKALVKIICCLLNTNGNGNAMCDPRGWLIAPKTVLNVYRPNAPTPTYFARLPLLHQILFRYAEAANTHNNNGRVLRIANVGIVYREHNNSFSFNMLNPKSILKWTKKPDCVATEVVLDATRFVSDESGRFSLALCC